jgi:PTH2 family peptidyl-tRNA hydrolase
LALLGKAKEQGIPYYLVADAGHTQVEAGSKTVLGLGPATARQLDVVTGEMKLL